jgi:phospholipid-binding lipoprotein MlaA
MMVMRFFAGQQHGHSQSWQSRLGRWCAVFTVFTLQACATVANPDPRDPMESWNRGVFGFNDTVDAAVIKPVAMTYKAVVPNVVRTGVGNFFSNLDDLWSGVNNALQLRGLDTAESFGRFLINTTWGLGGLLDIASEMGMERHNANFGLTLGRWGVGSGPFVVIPFWGSSTLRDTGAMVFDIKGNPVNHIDDVPRRDILTIVNLIDTRATYLKAGEVVEEAALDKYSFTRDAYLQRRRNQVYDGNPPEEEEAPDPSAPAQ